MYSSSKGASGSSSENQQPVSEHVPHHPFLPCYLSGGTPAPRSSLEGPPSRKSSSAARLIGTLVRTDAGNRPGIPSEDAVSPAPMLLGPVSDAFPLSLSGAFSGAAATLGASPPFFGTCADSQARAPQRCMTIARHRPSTDVAMMLEKAHDEVRAGQRPRSARCRTAPANAQASRQACSACNSRLIRRSGVPDQLTSHTPRPGAFSRIPKSAMGNAVGVEGGQWPACVY